MVDTNRDEEFELMPDEEFGLMPDEELEISADFTEDTILDDCLLVDDEIKPTPPPVETPEHSIILDEFYFKEVYDNNFITENIVNSPNNPTEESHKYTGLEIFLLFVVSTALLTSVGFLVKLIRALTFDN